MTLASVAGVSSLVAAVATVIGAVTLGLYFSRGEPWGKANDVVSIVLMLATVPVAISIAVVQSQASPMSTAAAGVGVVGMVSNAASQALLVLRRASYERLLPWTLVSGGVVGAWYILVALLGGLPAGFAMLATLAGMGSIGIGIGFWRGGQRDPLAALSFAAVCGASTIFLAYLGIFLLTGRIAIACCH